MKKAAITALVVAGLAVASFHGRSPEASAGPVGPSHQHQPVRFCAAVTDAALPDEYLSSLVHVENAFSGFLHSGDDLYRNASDGGENDYSRGREQAISWEPLSTFICDAADHGFRMRFKPGWFGNAPKYVEVESRGRTVTGRVEVDSDKGLDGEPKMRVVSFGSTGRFSEEDQGRFAYCLTNSGVALKVGDFLLGNDRRGKRDGIGDFCQAVARQFGTR